MKTIIFQLVYGASNVISIKCWRSRRFLLCFMVLLKCSLYNLNNWMNSRMINYVRGITFKWTNVIFINLKFLGDLLLLKWQLTHEWQFGLLYPFKNCIQSDAGSSPNDVTFFQYQFTFVSRRLTHSSLSLFEWIFRDFNVNKKSKLTWTSLILRYPWDVKIDRSAKCI